MAAAGFHSRYLSGPLPYVQRHITVNKMCWVRRKIKHFLPSFPKTKKVLILFIMVNNRLKSFNEINKVLLLCFVRPGCRSSIVRTINTCRYYIILCGSEK